MEVRVEYDYTAEERDELDLKQGDIVENVSQFEEGWFIGTFNGKEGVFPDNFVKVIKQRKPDEKLENGSANVNSTFTTQPKTINGGVRSPTRPKSQDENRRSPANLNLDDLSACDWVRVTFQYSPEQSDELELSVNDIIQVLDRNLPEEGWWRGQNVMTKRIGVFPDNFVKVINATDPDLKQTLMDNNFTSIPRGFRGPNSNVQNGINMRLGEPLATPSHTHSTSLPVSPTNKNKSDSIPKFGVPKKTDQIENPLAHCLSSITNDRPRQAGKRLPTKVTTNVSTLPVKNDKPTMNRQDVIARQNQLTKTSNLANSSILRRNSLPKSESDGLSRNPVAATTRPRVTSATRSDNTRSNDLSSKQLGDLQQVIKGHQEQLQAFAVQLSQFNSTLDLVQRDSREEIKTTNHKLEQLSINLDAVKDSQAKTRTELTSNQQTLVERIQSLTLEMDEVLKARSADAIELNRIKKIIMHLDSQALTGSLSGCGETTNREFTSPRGISNDTGSGKVYRDPMINLHNR